MKTLQTTFAKQHTDAVAVLKNALRVHNYHEGAMGERGVTTAAAESVADRPGLEYKVRTRDGLNTLIKLFLIGVEVERAWVSDVFEPPALATLLDAEVLREQPNDRLAAQVKIFPYNTFHFMCDFKTTPGHELVYDPGIDSVRLVKTAVRLPFERVLDVCTGTGIQAILASRHSTSVIGVDINPRAVQFARLNLLLNDINNVEFKLGDLYEPIAGNTFDLILANPPFVISPTPSAKYRDGGTRGDEVLRRIMAGLPQHLKTGGYSQIVTYLSEFDDASQVDDVERFAQKQQYATLLLLTPGFDAYQLAKGQYHNNQLRSPERYRTMIWDYLSHLETIQFKQGYSGVITFRNSGQFSLKKTVAFRQTAFFDLDPVSTLKDFYQIDFSPEE